MYSGYPEDQQQIIAGGLSDVSDVYGVLLAIDHDLDEAISTLRSVTRGATNEEPGRALNSLLRSKAEVAAAVEQLQGSATLAEQWANSLY